MTFYRFYECNLEAPYMKARTFTADELQVASLLASGLTIKPGNVLMYSGSSALGTTHTITSSELPLLANRSMCGTLNLFLNNTPYTSVVMAAVAKTNGALVQTQLYQNIGNMTSVALTISGNNIVLTTSPEVRCQWIFMGV